MEPGLEGACAFRRKRAGEGGPGFGGTADPQPERPALPETDLGDQGREGRVRGRVGVPGRQEPRLEPREVAVRAFEAEDEGLSAAGRGLEVAAQRERRG